MGQKGRLRGARRGCRSRRPPSRCRGAGTVTTRPSRPRNPRPPLIRFPGAARRTSSGPASVQMLEAPGGTAPGGAERRAGHPGDGRRSRASSGPAGWRSRRRGRPRRPPTRSPRRRPARPLPGTQGYPLAPGR